MNELPETTRHIPKNPNSGSLFDRVKKQLLPEKRTLIFIHIPKTAGTTLVRRIKLNFKNNALALPTDNLRSKIENIRDFPNDYEKYRFIHGHCPHGLGRLLANDSKSITLLRDPVERVISSFYHIKRFSQHPLHHEVSKMNVVDFSQNQHWPQFYNSSTRLLGAEMGNFSLEEYLRFNKSIADENSYARAEFAVNSEILVGIQEHFEESTLLFKRILNLKNIDMTGSEMINRNRPRTNEFSEREIEKIRESQELDQRLYEVAKQRFVTLCDQAEIEVA
ncbi:MAG: sulfotransferase family 2 domain-containing protein [Pseudobacteriovorax sp.]|nr:sulfotransferase family 2 domain-containing protein [Opitutales bacterium]NRA69213.1 sulfotransferase family 2 domain-containing protein [Pseudobacteriovorax sp.]